MFGIVSQSVPSPRLISSHEVFFKVIRGSLINMDVPHQMKPPSVPFRSTFVKVHRAANSHISRGQTKQDESTTHAGEGEILKQESFVHWFREAWPYIQGHRSSVFVVVLPGDVIGNSSNFDGILQDILLLHGLGVKLVIIPGTQPQIDDLLSERGHKPKYDGAYRITDVEALAASMEAAGRIRVAIEARLSRGTSVPLIRRAGDNDRRQKLAIASGNYLAAKRRGVVNGVDFGATGEVKRIDITRIRERLDNDCIVMLNNLGYSSTGEVLNCNTYEVATACAIALRAEKLLCMLDGPILDQNGRRFRFMSLREADKLIRERASQSSAATDYVRAVAGPAYVQILGVSTSKRNGSITNGAGHGPNGTDDHDGNGDTCAFVESILDNSNVAPATRRKNASGGGFAIGGEERLSRTNGYLSELTASVYACRPEPGLDDKRVRLLLTSEENVSSGLNGVGRVHLLDSNVQGALLLELYTRDGIGNMVSSDCYEGTRGATYADIPSMKELLKPLEEDGILVNPWKQLKQEIKNYIVVERDGSIVACAALFPHELDECGEVAAFAVSPECRGSGIGNALLEAIEKQAVELKLKRLFLLTTRTSDGFVPHGFSECTVDDIPERRQETINFVRTSKYYLKHLDSSTE